MTHDSREVTHSWMRIVDDVEDHLSLAYALFVHYAVADNNNVILSNHQSNIDFSILHYNPCFQPAAQGPFRLD